MYSVKEYYTLLYNEHLDFTQFDLLKILNLHKNLDNSNEDHVYLKLCSMIHFIGKVNNTSLDKYGTFLIIPCSLLQKPQPDSASEIYDSFSASKPVDGINITRFITSK